MPYQVCEPLYSANRNSKFKVNINQGGTSSAKTYTILQVLFDICIEERGVVITVAGQSIPNLKSGAIRDARHIVASSHRIQYHLQSYKKDGGYNKTDRIFTFRNGSIMEFKSYENEQSAKSGKRHYLFVNEANGIPFAIYWQLFIRTSRKVYIDYNPSAKFWVHDKVLGQHNATRFISDHRHNPFLSKEMHDEIESIPDRELWRVYARGLTGKITGLIYQDTNIIPAMPPNLQTVMGLDFGYNHKTALYEVAHGPRALYWNEIIYESNLTIGDLMEQMKELGIPKNKKIFCDHAAADKIEDLKRAKYNVYKADKDVKNGIDYVKRHTIYITKSSTGAITEAASYKWKVIKDPVSGAQVESGEPVKFKDDALDACRYGSYSHRKNQGYAVSGPDTGGGDEDDFYDSI